MHKVITGFEHDRLVVGETPGFAWKHKHALDKLNEYHQGAYFESIHKGIKLSQYVGVIQIDGLSIEIHPKADKDEPDARWKNVLLQMLKATGRLSPQAVGAASLKRQHLNLLEIYFELFLAEVEQLIRQGLVKKYRRRTTNTLALKGRLEFAGQIRKNLIHKERFYTTHTIYDTDHRIHHVLSHALDILEQFTRGTRLYDRCRRVLLDFPDTSTRQVSTQELNGIKLDRKTRPYTQALHLARLIILNYSPDISSGREKMLALLFDMNQLWEEFILKTLQRHCEEFRKDLAVIGQDSRSFWKNRTLRPDIVIQAKSDGKVLAIIDTKWKRPKDERASMDDLRQMYAYNRFWSSQRSILLYPGKSPMKDFHPFLDDDPFDHRCKLSFVDVIDNEQNLRQDLGAEILVRAGLIA